jgi:hypothetical protein
MFEAETDREQAGRPFFTSRLLSLAVAFFFAVFGVEKLAGSPDWVMVFNRIGFGQWFRYVTGAVQLGGALLLVVYRTSVIGAALLAATMVGAVLVQVMIMHRPTDGLFPGMFLLAILAAGAIELAERLRLRRKAAAEQARLTH